MPLARYFFVIGGVLLALLFISDAYLPKLSVAGPANTDLPAIRIHSDRKWPERVVYDASFAPTIPAQIANADVSVPASATVAVVAAKSEGRVAFAQMQPSDAMQLTQSEPRKPEHKRKTTRRRAAPSLVLVARQPRFPLFGNSIW